MAGLSTEDDGPSRTEGPGHRSSGEAFAGTAYVPEAFPYLLMKLSAFADRKDDANKDLGRHHALDAYTIVAMMTESEYERAHELAIRSRTDPHFLRACEVVGAEFAGPTSLGMLRLREHRLFREDFRLGEFAATLREILARS